MPIVDADTHVFETERTWDFMDQADAQHRPVAEIAKTEGFLRDRTVWNVAGELIHRVAEGHPMFPQGSGDLSRPDARIAHMDELGVDLHVMFPTFFTNTIFSRPQVELALARSYNRWMGSVYADYPRLHWALVPALQSMPQTLAMMDEARDAGARGVFMRGYEGDRSLDDPSLFPLYAKAADLGMAICVHAGNGSPAWASIRHTNQPVFNVAAFVGEMASAFNAVMVGRIAQQFPGLRFGFLESGSAWVPAVISRTRRMLEAFGPDGLGATSQLLEDEPMMANNLYVRYENYEDLEHLLKWAPAARIAFGSDYTHFDTSTKLDAHKDLLTRSDATQEIREQIVRRSSAELYGFQ